MSKAVFSPLDLDVYQLNDVITYVLGDSPEDVVGHIKQAVSAFGWIWELSKLAEGFTKSGEAERATRLLEVISHLVCDHRRYLGAVVEQATTTTAAAMQQGGKA